MFGGVWRYFFVSFSGQILDGWRCLKKNRSRHTEKGALLHIIVQYPPPSPPLLPTILRNIFPPRPPLLQKNIGNILRVLVPPNFYIHTYMCKGQPLALPRSVPSARVLVRVSFVELYYKPSVRIQVGVGGLVA